MATAGGEGAGARTFECTYTHMKRQKRKRWQDGTLKVMGNKMVLYRVADENRRSSGSIESHILSSSDLATGLVGETIETEKYLVDISDEVVSKGGSAAAVSAPAPAPPPAAVHRPRHLKRRRGKPLHPRSHSRPRSTTPTVGDTPSPADTGPTTTFCGPSAGGSGGGGAVPPPSRFTAAAAVMPPAAGGGPYAAPAVHAAPPQSASLPPQLQPTAASFPPSPAVTVSGGVHRSADDIIALFSKPLETLPPPPPPSVTVAPPPRVPPPSAPPPARGALPPRQPPTMPHRPVAVAPRGAPGPAHRSPTGLKLAPPSGTSAGAGAGASAGAGAGAGASPRVRLVRPAPSLHAFQPTMHRDVTLAPPHLLRPPFTCCSLCTTMLSSGPPGRVPDTTPSSAAACAFCAWRPVEIPTEVESLPAYRAVMRQALVQQINMQLADIAQRFFAALPRGWERSPPGAGKLKGAMKRRGVNYYANVTVQKAKAKLADSFTGAASDPSMLYLQLQGGQVGRSADYAKYDLWLFSTSPLFSGAPDARTALSFVAVSTFHGPTPQHRLQLQPLLPGDRFPSIGKDYSRQMHAIRGPNVSGEVGMLEVLNSLSPSSIGFLPSLLAGAKAKPEAAGAAARRRVDDAGPTLDADKVFKLSIPATEQKQLVDDVVEEFTLNPDQARVLRAVSSWFTPSDGRPGDVMEAPHVQLVHGVFGSGKSHMLVACCVMLARLLEHNGEGPAAQVLVASATNVAVDNVLLGLLRAGFKDFARVGSVRKMSRLVTPHVALATGPETKRTITDLKSMLATTKRGGVSGLERESVEEALEALLQKKKVRDQTAARRVVGVTCAATSFAVLAARSFPIVILDEASQMVEPSSLLPVARFGAHRLLAVGDPVQLPPPVASLPIQLPPAAAGVNPTHTLTRTLFERLADTGLSPIPLRTQYRCHPTLATLASKLFYRGVLKCGVTPAERPAIVPGLPPLTVINTAKGAEHAARSSISNAYEAGAVTHAVAELMEFGLEPRQVGVICLYRGQVYEVGNRLAAVGGPLQEACAQVQVSTVDAFQGAEKDVVLVSTCRTQRLGFITDPRRMNVALSRARHHLVVLGSPDVLATNTLWKEVMHLAAAMRHGMRDSSSRPLLCSAADLVPDDDELAAASDLP